MGNKRQHELTANSSHKKQKSAAVSCAQPHVRGKEYTDPCQSNAEPLGQKKPRPVASDLFSNSDSNAETTGPSNCTSSLSKALNYPATTRASFNLSSRTQHHHKSANGSPTHQPSNGHLSILPPLPPIRDASLARVAFTHPGSLNGHQLKSLDLSYDRLEFLGDAYIELIATRLIFPRFPKHSSGRLSQLRESLVKNETLAEYALAYGFDEKARLPGNFAKHARDKVWIKTMGDVFEAYVAAVIVDDPEQGFQTANAWLCALWENKLSNQPSCELQTADPDAKTQLGKKVLGKGIKLGYKDESPPQELRKEGKRIFHVAVYLTGWGWEDQFLGWGKGFNKQEAGAIAAKEALANPLTAHVASVKREFDDKVRAERERERDLLEEEEKDIKEEKEMKKEA